MLIQGFHFFGSAGSWSRWSWIFSSCNSGAMQCPLLHVDGDAGNETLGCANRHLCTEDGFRRTMDTVPTRKACGRRVHLSPFTCALAACPFFLCAKLKHLDWYLRAARLVESCVYTRHQGERGCLSPRDQTAEAHAHASIVVSVSTYGLNSHAGGRKGIIFCRGDFNHRCAIIVVAFCGLRILPQVVKQTSVCSALDDLALFHDKNLIGIYDSTETMRNHKESKAEPDTTLADLRFVLVGKVFNIIVDGSSAAHVLDFGICGLEPCVSNILPNCLVEKNWVLRHDTERFA
ncbi:hypothetical protein HBI07_247280 [Parastagonospora nodorum]|nr:hypothetical protein HBI07_247280 [Parastagonospora nodorum]